MMTLAVARDKGFGGAGRFRLGLSGIAVLERWEPAGTCGTPAVFGGW